MIEMRSEALIPVAPSECPLLQLGRSEAASPLRASQEAFLRACVSIKSVGCLGAEVAAAPSRVTLRCRCNRQSPPGGS